MQRLTVMLIQPQILHYLFPKDFPGCKMCKNHHTVAALLSTRFKRSMSTPTSSPQPATAPPSSPRPSSWVSSRRWSCCSSSPTPCTWWSTSSTSTATKNTRPRSTSPEAQKPRALRRATCRAVGSPRRHPSTETDSLVTLSSQARTSGSAGAGWRRRLKSVFRFWLCYYTRRIVVGQKERIPAGF